MSAWRWKNQYIDLVEAEHPLILNCAGPESLSAVKAAIEGLAAATPDVFLELGSGSGGHLIGHAARQPRALFFGLELRYKRTYKAAEKAAKKNLRNVRIVRANAEFAGALFHPGTLSGIFINFPDPWDKRRWKKHRLLNPEYLKTLHMLLKPGGFFSYKTDHGEYFSEILAVIASGQEFILETSGENPHLNANQEPYIFTEFEKLFLSKGLPTYFLLARKA